MRKILAILGILLIFPTVTFVAQRHRDLSYLRNLLSDDFTNRTDSRGLKMGYWAYWQPDSSLEVILYTAGKKNGLSMLFSADMAMKPSVLGMPLYMANYINDSISDFILFTENNLIKSQISDIKPITVNERTDSVNLYRGYKVTYTPMGSVSSEGWMLFGENFLQDTLLIGQWNYYDSIGNRFTRNYGVGTQ